MVKSGGSSAKTNGHLSNQNSINKDLMDIPNQKLRANHVRMSTMHIETTETFNAMKHVKDTPKIKETFMNNKEDKQINICDPMSPKTELIFISNDNYGKEQANLSDRNNTNLTLKTRVDITNNTSVIPVK